MNKPLGLGKILFFAAATTLLPQLAWAGPITLGSISFSPAREIKKFWPLASYLGKQLQSEGINKGQIVVAESIPTMSSFLQTGKVDLYIDSPFPSMAVSRLSGSKFLLRRWKKGIGEYHSIIFVRKDSSIFRLEDLKGKLIAFEEPFSSSGYFFPKIVLLRQGLRLVPKHQGSVPVRPDEVSYIFSNGDANTMFWVLSGVVMAGAVDNQKYLTMSGVDSFRIIHETVSFPRQIVSYRADLPRELVARVKEILITMDQSEEGRKVLQAFEKTTKFDELPDQAIDLFVRFGKYIDAELGLQ